MRPYFNKLKHHRYNREKKTRFAPRFKPQHRKKYSSNHERAQEKTQKKCGEVEFEIAEYGIPDPYNAEEPVLMDSRSTSVLAVDNYVSRFANLLWLEEVVQVNNLRRYDRDGVRVNISLENEYSIQVPGLADGSGPPLNFNHIVKLGRSSGEPWFFSIREIKDDYIIISLEKELEKGEQEEIEEEIEENCFRLSFELPRIAYRRMHHAINHLGNGWKLGKIAFPVGGLEPREPAIFALSDNVKFFNPNLNRYQTNAVVNILRSVHRPAPYLLLGPPGTGKTATLIEATLQVYKLQSWSRILICGSSNACADLWARKLLDSKMIKPGEMCRLVARRRRKKKSDPDDLSNISGSPWCISLSDVRVVICTCNLSCELNHFKSKFDFIFVDEASQANEPETMIPLDLATDCTSLVLAGDPYQLGPVCQSQLAKENGLGTSLMERLFNLEVYKKREIDGILAYDNNYITKLNISYRCDPRVMVVNNAMFYENELEFEIRTPEVLLSKMGFKNPSIFHPVRGREERLRGQTSWCNTVEVIQCFKYVDKLYEAGISRKQIGIITPYRAQIREIKEKFDSQELAECRVDTVEGFQGDEREVIIISMVRTTEQMESSFLFDKRRFNVAVSRAKWLCIVIGHPDVLETDKCWSEYMKTAEKVKFELLDSDTFI